IVPPGADTPLFYLVASSKNGGSGNLAPLRTTGGAGGYATLTGSNPIGQFYFYQGSLIASPRPGSTSPQRPLIGSLLNSTGCSEYGSLGFTEGSSTNKCARYNSFHIQSNPENAQLGARLSFNYFGQFYACGSGGDVWYKTTSSEGPGDCTAIDLYTVPVI
ncbi:hypothetical protein AGABI2DRAFT_195536, partial [Agaricus bisporus var. bisporus H97]|uniref:hypothetical protein n=1 Tax=Agaricus bisporus var. bisporus (strain H97 / ATCC MYA-4626 / FGSC 10389) TaxID=936046 RepID=UPI00029F77F3